MDTTLALLDGCRLGEALDGLGHRYAEMAIAWNRQSFEVRPDSSETDTESRLDLWIALHDARARILLGDPAVRLPGTRWAGAGDPSA